MASQSTPGSSKSHLQTPYVTDAKSVGGALESILETTRMLVSPLASLKITVTLLTLSIFIVLFGTLAQVDMDMWEVMSLYFRSWVAWVDFRVLIPRTWYPPSRNFTGGFFFPGGASIGLGLALNLLAAGISGTIGWVLTNLVRTKKKPNYVKLLGGAGALAVGITATALIILHGHNRDGLQGVPFFEWQTLWLWVKTILFLAFLGSLVGFLVTLIREPRKLAEWMLLGLSSLMFGIPAIYLLLPGNDAYVGDSGMRILWQLLQATGAALILLLGFWPLFNKRAGVALLHSGVALMMFGQYFVGRYDVEEQMSIQEGQVMNYAHDIRSVELAVIDGNDPKNPEEESVIAIPLHRVGTATRFLQGRISDSALPFDLQIVEFHKNSDVHMAKEGDKKVATAGRGKDFVSEERKRSSGTDMGGGVDLASAYVNVLKKGTDESLGTYLVSQVVLMMRDGKEFGFDEQIEVDGKKYDLALRFQRNYKPYTIELQDVRKEDYIGTNTPRDYSSIIHLVDPRRNENRSDIRIWMNNPLRYAGETFYQSGYHVDQRGKEHTTLQVVRNSGWMIPYVACMLVVVGMCAHFVQLLIRFLRRKSSAAILESFGSVTGSPFAMFVAWAVRRSHAAKLAAPAKGPGTDKDKKSVPNTAAQTGSTGSEGAPLSLANILVPTGVVLVFAALFSYTTRPPKEPTIVIKPAKGSEKEGQPGEPQVFDVHAFGRLPVVADGRVKPFDTLARNSLRVLSGRETFIGENGKSQPAILWLLDVISSSEAAYHHKVFRIDNLEVLDTLGLTKRQGFLYSVEELMPKIGKFEEQVEQAREQEKKKASGEFSVYQRKLLEVDARIRTFTKIGAAFRRPDLPPLPTEEDFNKDRSVAIRKMEQFRQSFAAFSQSLEKAQTPLAVPIRSEAKKEYEWEPYSKAWVTGYISATMLNQDPAPTLKAMDSILVNYASGNGKKFNQSVRDYRDLLDRLQLKELVVTNTWLNHKIESNFGSVLGFEAYFNHVAPFYYADAFYVFAFILAALAWLGFRRPLNSASFWLLVFTFTIHTIALLARIYISGRPPVTNLYSSAVFIGWGCVAFCLLIEVMYGMGIGNVIAAITGFGSLFIAHNLAADGDTFTVLQAVLDTQFWLATHVVCITFGYATTFLAGFLGIFYILKGVFTPSLTQDVSKNLNRMIYGIVCFSIFFSFFGTVLGGLWADDSWGRFWGWDPKENGALIIVLWNAVLLHARWGGMVEERGLAVLAVLGNVVTAWSWFGVNELGVGLHSYGFTEGRLFYLGMFVVSQLLFVAIGCLPRQVWWSANVNEAKPTSASLA